MVQNSFNKHFKNRDGIEVHLVQSYQIGVDRGGRFSAFADGSDVSELVILLVPDATDDNEYKISFSANATGAISIKLFESPTVTANGTEIEALNKKRNFTPEELKPKFYTSSIITSNGTQIAFTVYTGGSGAGQTSIGGGAIGTDEFIIDNSKSYLLLVETLDTTENISAEINISGAELFNT